MKTHYPSEGGLSEEKFRYVISNLYKVAKLNPDIQTQYLRSITRELSFEEQKELYRFFSLVTSHLMQEFWR